MKQDAQMECNVPNAMVGRKGNIIQWFIVRQSKINRGAKISQKVSQLQMEQKIKLSRPT